MNYHFNGVKKKTNESILKAGCSKSNENKEIQVGILMFGIWVSVVIYMCLKLFSGK